MDASTWRLAKDLIARALELPADAREAFLHAQCEDVALREEVRSYLQSYSEQPTRPFEWPSSDGGTAAPVGNDLIPGARIGHYTVLGNLGQGGMGHVLLCEDVDLHRKVALKSLLTSADSTARARARIRREATAAAQISHPNVATVYDVIHHADRDLIVMEYVDGESLAALMRRERLTADRVVAIGKEIASALGAAHAKGVIHRDLKPANIQMTKAGSVKVLDFGVAGVTTAFTTVSAAGDDDPAESQPGTPGYMSPEQMLNHHVDGRTDIFSAGIVLFEMATGERAFATRDPGSLMDAIERPVRRTDAVDGRVPRALADVIAKALEVDLARRFHSAAELESALVALSAGGKSAVDPHRSTWPALARRAVRVAAGVFAGMIVLTGIGFLTTWTMDVALGRTEFDHDGILQWFAWGRRSCAAQLFWLIVITLGLTVAAGVRDLALLLSPLGRRFDATSRDRIRHTARRLRLDEISVAASWLLLGSAVTLLASWWHFRPLLAVVLSRVAVADAESLALLAPIPNTGDFPDTHFDLYRMTFSVIAIGSTVAWYGIVKVARRSGQTLNWAMSLGGSVIVLLAVVLLALPFRLAYHAKFRSVEYKGQHCFQIGEDADEWLLFCPDRPPNRNSVVNKDSLILNSSDPENIFKTFAK